MTVVLRRFALFRLFPVVGFQIINESRSTEDLPGFESYKCLTVRVTYAQSGQMQRLFLKIFAPVGLIHGPGNHDGYEVVTREKAFLACLAAMAS
jgi:hypothetical protein